MGAPGSRVGATHEVVAVDLRGHGESPASPPFDVLTMAADLVGVLEHLALEDPLLVGHSLGGTVVTATAAVRPGAVESSTSSSRSGSRPSKTSCARSSRPCAATAEFFEEALSAVFASLRGPLSDEEWARIGAIRRLDQEVVLGVWSFVLDTSAEELDRAVDVGPRRRRGCPTSRSTARIPGPGTPSGWPTASRPPASSAGRATATTHTWSNPTASSTWSRQSASEPRPAGPVTATAGAPAADRRRRSWWGWGWADEAIGGTELDGVAAVLAARFPGADPPQALPVPDPARSRLPRPGSPRRPRSPASAPRIRRRARPTPTASPSGTSYAPSTDDLAAAPDLVARPSTEQELVDLLDWCSSARAAAIPYGGGSSVVGGVEGGAARDRYEGVVSIDLSCLAGVAEVDTTSGAARIRAGTFGPDLEDGLRPYGLTLRHFPQSFEHSTLGGWIATRSGGHFATNRTRIDDFVESMRVVTPAGTLESRRLPGSGAGPSPDRLFLGSEGALGVVTEAWVRLQRRPRHRAGAAVRFATFEAGAAAARAVVQAGLFPSNCRLLDPEEAAPSGGGGRAVLLLGFESPSVAVDHLAASALECCLDHGGEAPVGHPVLPCRGHRRRLARLVLPGPLPPRRGRAVSAGSPRPSRPR